MYDQQWLPLMMGDKGPPLDQKMTEEKSVDRVLSRKWDPSLFHDQFRQAPSENDPSCQCQCLDCCRLETMLVRHRSDHHLVVTHPSGPCCTLLWSTWTLGFATRPLLAACGLASVGSSCLLPTLLFCTSVGACLCLASTCTSVPTSYHLFVPRLRIIDGARQNMGLEDLRAVFTDDLQSILTRDLVTLILSYLVTVQTLHLYHRWAFEPGKRGADWCHPSTSLHRGVLIHPDVRTAHVLVYARQVHFNSHKMQMVAQCCLGLNATTPMSLISKTRIEAFSSQKVSWSWDPVALTVNPITFGVTFRDLIDVAAGIDSHLQRLENTTEGRPILHCADCFFVAHAPFTTGSLDVESVSAALMNHYAVAHPAFDFGSRPPLHFDNVIRYCHVPPPP